MKVVLCGGIFDLIHVGHLRHLEEARRMGDKLVVGLTMDEFAQKEKRKPVVLNCEGNSTRISERCLPRN